MAAECATAPANAREVTNVNLGSVSDPLRRRARVALAMLVSVLMVFLLFSSSPGALLRAFAQSATTTTSCGATIAWLNPSADNTNISDQSDGDAGYHLVATVKNRPSNAVVGFTWREGTGVTHTITPSATLVGTDTYEFFWDPTSPEFAPEDTEVTLSAILTVGGTECTRDEIDATANQDDGMVGPPLDSKSESLSILDPLNGAGEGFFKGPDNKFRGRLRVRASADTGYVHGFYTTSPVGTDPTWQSCTADDIEYTGGTTGQTLVCVLNGTDQPASVTGIAAEPNATPPPLPPADQLIGSRDAHRVLGYVQTASSLVLEFIDGSGNGTGDTVGNAAVNVCSPVLRATVKDQNGKVVVGANVDVHATGPDDGLQFGTGTGADTFQMPDKGSHTEEDANDCAGAADGSEGNHSRLSDPDIKHIESVLDADNANTNGDGAFHFRLYHGAANTPGTTQVTAWADTVDNNDIHCLLEPADNASIGWQTAAPAPTGVPAEQSSCSATPSTATTTTTTTTSTSPAPCSSTTSASPSTSPSTTPCATTTSPSTTTTSAAPSTSTSTTTPPPPPSSVRTTARLGYNKPFFHGRAKSRVKRCRSNRRFKLKQVKPGPDKLIAKGTTDKRGLFKVKKRNAHGNFYAQISKKTFFNGVGSMITCKRDRSNTKHV